MDFEGKIRFNNFTLAEKRQISKSIIWGHTHESLLDLDCGYSTSNVAVTVLSAYSENYRVGEICKVINQIYCERHSYDYICRVLSLEVMLSEISPRTHCTWYKVKMIIEELDKILLKSKESIANTTHYILWIDADAIFINHVCPIEEFVVRGRYKNLIVAEDMTPCCLINAGVMLIKVNEWSKQLWGDIWKTHQYYSKPFFDQSALIKCLKTRHQGMHFVQPFHTFLRGSDQSDKFFPHVSVFPHIDFNTNRGYVCNKPKVLRKYNRTIDKSKSKFKNPNETSDVNHSEPHHDRELAANNTIKAKSYDDTVSRTTAEVLGPTDHARYIFHAAGRCDKINSLLSVIRLMKLNPDVSNKFTSINNS